MTIKYTWVDGHKSIYAHDFIYNHTIDEEKNLLSYLKESILDNYRFDIKFIIKHRITNKHLILKLMINDDIEITFIACIDYWYDGEEESALIQLFSDIIEPEYDVCETEFTNIKITISDIDNFNNDDSKYRLSKLPKLDLDYKEIFVR